jgi:hypothetical protein
LSRILSTYADIQPYAIHLHDDQLSVMVYNRTGSTYDELWLDKFGRTPMDHRRQLQTPMIIRYIHEYTFPVRNRSTSNHVAHIFQ